MARRNIAELCVYPLFPPQVDLRPPESRHATHADHAPITAHAPRHDPHADRGPVPTPLRFV
nr:MAG TPA: hypothetical protein [Caudoviricetes sp.]